MLVLIAGDLLGELPDGPAAERHRVAASHRAALPRAVGQALRQSFPVHRVGVELRLEVLEVQREVEDRAVGDCVRVTGLRCERRGGHPPEQARADQPQARRARALQEPRPIGRALRAPADQVIRVLLSEHLYSSYLTAVTFSKEQEALAGPWSIRGLRREAGRPVGAR